jgi:hypothetical protein
MSGDLYHLFVRPNVGVTRAQVEEVLGTSIDWYRYEEGLYILHSSTNEDVWFQRLEKLVKPSGFALIYRLSPSRYMGFMPKTFWEWLEKKAAKDSS